MKFWSINNGDNIFICNFLYKDITSNPVNLKIWDNQGNLLQTFEVQHNTQTNPNTLWTTYEFEDNYDYIIIGTESYVPVYGQELKVSRKVGTNDLNDVLMPKGAIQSQLDNKVNHWDIVQSDWEQSDTGAKDYIKNKPNNIVTANQTLSVAVVSSMPESPDVNTLYLVTGS